MEQEVVKCPVCDKYEVTIETQEDFESRICLNCGFTTNSELEPDSDYVKIFESMQPKVIVALKHVDESLKQIWYPFSMYIETRGALYPEGNEKDWKWAYAPVVVIPIMERLQYPIEGEVDRYHETRLGVEQAEYFDTFKEAYNQLQGEE